MLRFEEMFGRLHDNPPPPFNPDFVPGLRERLNAAYAQYCDEHPKSSQLDRAAAYRRLAKLLTEELKACPTN